MSISLKDSLKNRDIVVNEVVEEIIGPSQITELYQQLDISSGIIHLPDTNSFYNIPYYYLNNKTKEEILRNTTPKQRYTAGQLFPINLETAEEDDLSEFLEIELLKNSGEETVNVELITDDSTEDMGNIEMLPQKNDFIPSTIGLTFCIEKDIKEFSVQVSGGNYNPISVYLDERKDNYKQTWWYRTSVSNDILVSVNDLTVKKHNILNMELSSNNNSIESIKIQIQLLLREISNRYIITVSATNRSNEKENKQEHILYQSKLSISTPHGSYFSSYPRKYQLNKGWDEEALVNELLYRNEKIYALGHGCSTDWSQDIDKVSKISTSFIPQYETHSVTPNVEVLINGEISQLEFRMSDLAGISTSKPPREILRTLVQGYDDWIKNKESEIDNLPNELQPTGINNIKKCKDSLSRIQEGLSLLDTPAILKAFQLANLAILMQQINGKEKSDGFIGDQGIEFEKEFPHSSELLDDLKISQNTWRPFQIAFILMSLKSIVNEESPEREIVDLIWFPTGGGKTEAYLGVAAFLMVYRRMLDPKDAGVNIIMRYTLRLLTADQFQRSARLICALEYIRRDNVSILGDTPYSIGIWVGSKTTPNSIKSAKTTLQEINKGDLESGFTLHNCPWCGAKLGFYDEKNTGNTKKVRGRKKGSTRKYLGYKFDSDDNTFKIYCPDKKCNFHGELPVYIVDETIYSKRPTFLIGTIDKFVQLLWKPESRSLFGLNDKGHQIFSPPSLIIQDELHLISGPLGTLSGLFEILIEELCTKEINGKKIKPKIIAATATIKRFKEQTLALFGREDARIFPPSGLDYEDSFFAKPAMDKEGKYLPGRLYVGVNTSTVKLPMNQVMSFSAILQAPIYMNENTKDPYWTLVSFYNTLRELGGGLTFAQTDIPNYLNSMLKRKGIDSKRGRKIDEFLELTSRKQSHEISNILDKLRSPYPSSDTNSVIDLCLASNIIEVGVDIDRLSIMTIVGQPKMTSQYIQVSGRIGRQWQTKPGVIFTLYSNTKSRDKSHYEHFREYHQKLYGQVEPTSVTPFSDSSLERGLMAIVIAYLRQNFDQNLAYGPDKSSLQKYDNEISEFYSTIIQKCKIVDPEQMNELIYRLDKIRSLLANPPFPNWVGDDGIMYPIGTYNDSKKQIAMINSLRSVDAQCLGDITVLANDKPQDYD